MAEPTQIYDVFLSHGSPDRPWVETLARELKDLGLKAFPDIREIEPAASFPLVLSDALAASRFLVLVLSPHSTRAWVSLEWSSFLSHHGPLGRLLPVMLEPTDVPALLASIQRIDATDLDAARVAREIARIVGRPGETEEGDARRLFLGQDLVGGVAALPTDYAGRIRNFLSWYLGQPGQPVPFGGREADLCRLDAWLGEPGAAPYLALVAPAGRGKSALLVRWSRRCLARDDWAIVLFPVSVRARTNLAGVVFPSLVAQLSRLHAERVPDLNTPMEVWRGLFRDLLEKPLSDGRRLLVILDGLDEAADFKPGMDLFPLPPPAGLRVVVAARPRAGEVDASGWVQALGWDRSGVAFPLELLPLTRDGLADVLARMGRPLDALAARKGVVTALHELTNGDPLLVGLYVDELWRQRERAPRLRSEDLSRLKPGLRGYFERWWEEQRRLWGDRAPLREPPVQALLGILACARGPLRCEDLLNLAPAHLSLNSFMLTEALRDLERLVVATGEEQGYVFSHSQLGQFQRDLLSAEEQQQWEERFLGWGRATLAALNEGSLQPEAASAYLVQYLGAHLESQGVEPLSRLISDGWRRAWEAFEGTYTGFLHDVDRLWRAAEEEDGRGVTAQGYARFIGLEIRCALCHASVRSLARNIPPELMAALVKAGVWTPRQALGFARPMQEPAALKALASHLPQGVLSEALAAACAMEGVERRAEALLHLAPHLPKSQRREALLETLDLLARSSRPEARGWALAISALCSPYSRRERELRKVLDLVGRNADSGQGLALLSALAPDLPDGLLPEVLELVADIEDAESRAGALVSLAPYLPRSLLPRALELAHDIGSADAWAKPASARARAWALGVLAIHLPPDQRETALSQPLDLLHSTDAEDRAWALAALAPHLPNEEREERMEGALDLLREVEHDWERLPLVSALASHLPDRVLLPVLELVRKILDAEYCAEALVHLAAYLPESFLPQALDLIPRMPELWSRGTALAAIAPRLPEDLISQALKLAAGCRAGWGEAKGLAALAPHLPEDLIPRALEIAGEMDVTSRAQVLAAVAPFLTEHRRTHEIREMVSMLRNAADPEPTAWAVGHLGPLLPRDVIRRAFETVPGIPDPQHRAWALAHLAPHLPQDLLPKALELATGPPSSSPAAHVLAALAPHLPENLIARALGLTDRIKEPWYRAWALAGIAPFLPAHRRLQAFREALELARTSPDNWPRLRVLEALATHLPESVLPQAFELALELPHASPRAVALTPLAPRLASLPAEARRRMWHKALRESAGFNRAGLFVVLHALEPVWISLGGPQAAEQVAQAIIDVGRWWR